MPNQSPSSNLTRHKNFTKDWPTTSTTKQSSFVNENDRIEQDLFEQCNIEATDFAHEIDATFADETTTKQ